MQAWKLATVDIGLALSRLRRLVATVQGQRCNIACRRITVAAVGRCSGTRDDDVTIVIVSELDDSSSSSCAGDEDGSVEGGGGEDGAASLSESLMVRRLAYD